MDNEPLNTAKGPLFGKNVLVGITSSRSCYKTCELIRLLIKNGASVKTVVSPATLEFIGEKTLETLSNNKVHYDTFSKSHSTEHINLTDWADIFVIAPITANTISKFASGIADNLITSTFNAYLGLKKPVIIAPAMNTGLLNNIFVQNNVTALKNAGVKIVESETGPLACGTVGKGRMADVEKIYKTILETLCPATVSGKTGAKGRVLLTMGGTREPIDPVRFISNASSGRMGLCLADCAHSMGYDVEIISTVKIENRPYKITIVNSTLDMLDAVEKSFKEADYLIMAAAVADYRVKNPSTAKLSKKNEGETLTLELVQNPDILKNMGQIKKENQITYSVVTNYYREVYERAGFQVSKNQDYKNFVTIYTEEKRK